MSTKSSIIYGDNYHMYNEIFSDEVYLEVSGKKLDFSVTPTSVTVSLPPELMKALEVYFRKKPKSQSSEKKFKFPKFTPGSPFAKLEEIMKKTRKIKTI